MSRHRVVVTGLGLVSPVGNSVAEGWADLVADKPGITAITKFDPPNLTVYFAGEVKGFNVKEYIPAKETHSMDMFIHYGIVAGVQALKGSGLEVTEANAERIGVLAGSGVGGLSMIEDARQTYVNRGPRRTSSFLVPGSIINMIPGHLSIMFGLKRPNLAAAMTCVVGLHSIGLATRPVQAGDTDVMVASGAESTTSPLGIGGFTTARTLSTRSDDPTTASHPWDKNHDGLVPGKGAGVMMLEGYESTKARGTTIYAEVADFDMNGDTFHMTAPNMDGPCHCVLNTLRGAGVNADQVHYLNVHGMSTPPGDKNEFRAIKAVFGDHMIKIIMNSTKFITSHLLGGMGGLESVFTVFALHSQVSPPTINIFGQDPEYDLDYRANTAWGTKIDMVVKSNFGFGGMNGTLVFRRP